jgi:hypothetical protein
MSLESFSMDESAFHKEEKSQSKLKIRELLNEKVKNNLKEEVSRFRDSIFQLMLRKATYQTISYLLNNMTNLDYEKIYSESNTEQVFICSNPSLPEAKHKREIFAKREIISKDTVESDILSHRIFHTMR